MPVIDYEEALALSHVVDVEEMLSARENIRVLAVTNRATELHEITSDLDSLGLTIERESLLRATRSRPFDHSGENMVSRE